MIKSEYTRMQYTEKKWALCGGDIETLSSTYLEHLNISLITHSVIQHHQAIPIGQIGRQDLTI